MKLKLNALPNKHHKGVRGKTALKKGKHPEKENNGEKEGERKEGKNDIKYNEKINMNRDKKSIMLVGVKRPGIIYTPNKTED